MGTGEAVVMTFFVAYFYSPRGVKQDIATKSTYKIKIPGHMHYFFLPYGLFVFSILCKQNFMKNINLQGEGGC